jgi:hypothetical protein
MCVCVFTGNTVDVQVGEVQKDKMPPDFKSASPTADEIQGINVYSNVFQKNKV